MKYKNTLDYYYTNVKSLLEQVDVPSDFLFGQVKKKIVGQIDLQLSGNNTTIFEDIRAMHKVLQNVDYAFNNKISDPEKVKKLQELAIHLDVLINIQENEAMKKVEKKEVERQRLPNPGVTLVNGVWDYYQPNPGANNRVPNKYY